MRILITGCTYHPAFNGQAIFTVHLAEGLAGRGHEVMVLAPSEQTTLTVRNGVQVQTLRSVQLKFIHPDTYLPVFQDSMVADVFDSFQPEIVHVQDHYPLSRSALKVARQRGVKVVGTNHFLPENLAPYLPFSETAKSNLNWVMWRWMLDVFNRIDMATAPSKTAASILRRQGLRVPVSPISCGVDLDRFHPVSRIDRCAQLWRYGLDPERIVFLFVGRVDGEKRLDVLLQAFHDLDREDVQLGIAGEGAALKELHELAARLQLGDKVRFTGFVPGEDLPGLLNSVDFFAMPSEAELLSIATLEAMACGRPVLAARARALPELVSDGVNGFLFQPGNAQDAVQKIKLLIDQLDRWNELSAASLSKVQPHSLENSLSSYESIYARILDNAFIPNRFPNLSRRRSLGKRIHEGGH